MKGSKVKVILYGLRPIGVKTGNILEKGPKRTLDRKIEIVGAVDTAEDKVGKDLGELLQLKRRMNYNCVRFFR